MILDEDSAVISILCEEPTHDVSANLKSFAYRGSTLARFYWKVRKKFTTCQRWSSSKTLSQAGIGVSGLPLLMM